MTDCDAGDEDDENGAKKPRTRKWLHLRSEDLAGLDPAVARQVLRDYGRLVIHLAKRYPLPERNHGPLTFDDMVATGETVLLQCWVRFNPNKGAKFSTWASLNLRRTFSTLARESRGRTLTDQQNEMSGRERRPALTVVSLDEPISLDGQSTVGDRIAMFAAEHMRNETPEDLADASRNRTWLRAQIDRVLNERERDVILAMLSGENGVEIGERLGVTRQRIDQLYQRATDKLRHAAWDDDLIDGAEPPGGPLIAVRGGKATPAAPAPAPETQLRRSGVQLRRSPVVHDDLEEAEIA